MAKDILMREQEFLKMNDELDKKTKSFIDKSNINPTLLKNSIISRQSSNKKSPSILSTISKSPTNDQNQDITRISSISKKSSIFKPLVKKSNTIPRQNRDVLTIRKPSSSIKDNNNKKQLNIDTELYGNMKFPTTRNNSISSPIEQTTESLLSTTPVLTTQGITKIIPKDKSILSNHQKNNNDYITKIPDRLTSKLTKLTKKPDQPVVATQPSKIKSSSNKTTPTIQSPKKQPIKNNNNIDYLKSLNAETNEILQETFRNKKFSYSISSENLADSKIQYNNDDDNDNDNNNEAASIINKKVINNNNCDTGRSELTTSTPTNTMETFKTITGRTSISTSTWKSNGSNATNRTDHCTTTATTGVKKNLTPNGLIKYLKTKVQLLQEELETSTNLILKRNKELEKSYEQQKKLEKERDQAISKNNSLTEQYEILEGKYKISVKNLKEFELQYKNINREMDNIKRELKILEQTNINLEKRLYRSNEELDNTKINLNQLQNNEREIKEMTRIENDNNIKKIKQLKKQKLELIGAYKKQLYLIDNLKRQNICMEQAKLIGFGEKEFTKVLEWNSTNVKK